MKHVTRCAEHAFLCAFNRRRKQASVQLVAVVMNESNMPEGKNLNGHHTDNHTPLLFTSCCISGILDDAVMHQASMELAMAQIANACRANNRRSF